MKICKTIFKITYPPFTFFHHFRRREIFAIVPLDENVKNIFREERAEKYDSSGEKKKERKREKP